MKFDFTNPFKTLFIIWALASIVILPLMSLNAGITEDEPVFNDLGKTVVAWYEGRDKTAIQTPFDDKGQWIFVTKGDKDKAYLNIYGGLYNTIAAFTYEHITHDSLGEYESNHIVAALFGALMLIFTGLICYKITDSWNIAFLGIVIVTFCPRLIGNSLNNPKDIPQATMFAFSLLQMVSFFKELPNIRWKRLILLGLSFSLAIAMRSGAVILIFYFMAFTGLHLFHGFLTKELDWNKIMKVFFTAFAVSVLGYLGCSLFWPWALMNPLVNPLLSLAVFKNFDAFNCPEIFEGKWMGNGEIPWYFVPKWLYMTIPVTVTLGFGLFFVLIPKFLKKGWSNLLVYGLIIFSVFFPVLSIIINKSNIFNSARHVMFVIPSITVIATLGWSELFNRVKDVNQKLVLYIVFAGLMAEPALFIMNNNPIQAIYFSPLIGGEKGAFKNYEMDYWGYSVRPAIDWLENTDSLRAPGTKSRVRMWYGEQLKLSYYAAKSKNLTYVLCEENSTNWDYAITLPSEAKFNHDLLYHWPPIGTIHEITADGVPICAIVKNPRIITVNTTNTAQPTLTVSQPLDSSTLYLNLGIQYYQKANYNQAVIAFKRSLAFNPSNKVAFNDVVASYNQLKMFDEAILYAEKGLTLDPGFELLKNNLNESLKARKTFAFTEGYYHDLSYNYYVQGDYLKVIESAKNALKINPNSSIGWNNMCSAYNQLGQYQKALDACDRGLKIDAKNVMLKNNRIEAAKMLGQK